MEPTQVRLTIPDSVDPTALMGPADSLLRRIEDGFDAMVSVRGNVVSVSGPADVVDQVTSVFSRLIRLVEMGESPSVGEVDVIIDQVRHGAERTSLVNIEARARFESTRVAYGVGAAIILLGLLTTPAIKTFEKKEAAPQA